MSEQGERSSGAGETSRLGRIVDWFIPADLMQEQGEDLRKARLIIWACLLFLVLTVFPVTSALLSDTTKAAAWFMGSVMTMAMIVPFLLRQGLSLRRLTLVVTIVPIVAMGGSSYTLGGIHVPSAQAMLLIPVYGFFLGGPRHGFITLLVVSAVHVALGIQAMDQPGEAAPRTVSLIAVDGFLYLLVLGFHNVAKRAYQALDRSIQELRTSNDELCQARDATESALKAKTRLLATMSHEVRTPMSGMVGLVRMVQDKPMSDDLRENMALLLGSSEALLAVVNDVLDLARVESGHLELSKDHFRPQDLLGNAARLMRGTVPNKAVEVRHAVGDQLPEWLCGDQGRVRQILLNLLGNALRFTRVGHVEVRARVTEQRGDTLKVRFAVEDTGVGLTTAQRARVFDAFAQVHSPGDHKDQTQYAGTGLGLTICKELVSLMGGTIGVDSKLGVGSTFWFEIAMAVGRDPTDELRSVRLTEHRSNGAGDVSNTSAPVRVLVAEDNVVNRRVVENMLQSLGCDVHAVCTGAEAVSAVMDDGAEYDLVLMDRWMPDMDGVQATCEIRRHEQGNGSRARLIVVALSASSAEDERRTCLDAGMDDYLMKPASKAQLSKILRHNTAWRSHQPPAPRGDAHA